MKNELDLQLVERALRQQTACFLDILFVVDFSRGVDVAGGDADAAGVHASAGALHGTAVRAARKQDFVLILDAGFVRGLAHVGYGLRIADERAVFNLDSRAFADLDGHLDSRRRGVTGGADVDPALYRDALSLSPAALAEGEALVKDPTPERDAADLYLLAGAEARGLPILGICHGLQIMNIAHGGTLYHDIPAQAAAASGAKAIVHNKHMDGCLAHEVGIVPGTRLAKILDGEAGDSLAGGSSPREAADTTQPMADPLHLTVNSMHHQAIRDMAPCYVGTATAPDGIIEAIEQPGEAFAVGVQWHPEYHAEHAPMQLIFRAFVSAAAKGAAARAGA